MHVLIPAGGRGLRLRPITNYRPKPLLPLGDRPILTHILDGIPPDFAVTVVVTKELEREFCDWRDSLAGSRDVQIYVEQPRLTGRGGPVSAVAEVLRERAIDDDLILLMGDSVLPFTIRDFLPERESAHLKLAAFQLPDIRQASRFGVLELTARDTVASFEEKPPQPRSPWVFTGCLYLPKALLPALHEFAETCSPEMGQIVVQFHQLGQEIEVFRAAGEWHDIGTFQSYLAAHQCLVTAGDTGRLHAAANEASGCVYVDPRARVERSVLRNCLIFGDAQISDATLTDCVVWPQVRITARTVENTLFATDGEFAIGAGY